MAQYIKNGEIYDGKSIVIGDRRYLSPSEATLLAAGYTKVEPQEPTDEEVAAMQRAQRIEELKAQLAATDYIALKSVEGYDCDTLYPNWKAQRAALRNEINELEAHGK